METGYQTKNMQPAKTDTKILQDFFFPGGMEYEPITIAAGNRQEAEKEWEKVRKPVTK